MVGSSLLLWVADRRSERRRLAGHARFLTRSAASVWSWALLGLLATVATAGRVVAADIPDAWFFDGANRPKPLKDLEGKAAPDLDLSTWIGDETSIKGNRGKVVVVDFWATWCGPCMASIPKNIELVKTAKEKGLVFIGVHDSKSGWEKAQGVVNDKGINYPVAKDSGESVKRFNLQFWPTYVVIDRAGTVRAAGLLPDKVHEVVDMLLAEPPPADVATGGESGNPAEWYFGGAKRPAWLKAVEGKRFPSFDLAKETEWCGDAPKPESLKGRIQIVHFLSPTNEGSMKQLAELEKLVAAFEPQGVSFVGICDARVDWVQASATLKARNGKIPIVRDAPGTAEVPLGAKAAELGLRLGGATLVVDRAGVVRAAGIRHDRLKDALTVLLAEPTPSTQAAEPTIDAIPTSRIASRDPA